MKMPSFVKEKVSQRPHENLGDPIQDDQWKKKLKPGADNNGPLVVAVYNSGAPVPNTVTPVVPASPVKAAPSPVRAPSPTKVVD